MPASSKYLRTGFYGHGRSQLAASRSRVHSHAIQSGASHCDCSSQLRGASQDFETFPTCLPFSRQRFVSLPQVHDLGGTSARACGRLFLWHPPKHPSSGRASGSSSRCRSAKHAHFFRRRNHRHSLTSADRGDWDAGSKPNPQATISQSRHSVFYDILGAATPLTRRDNPGRVVRWYVTLKCVLDAAYGGA